MSSVFSRYNKSNYASIDWGVDTDNFPFVKCSDQELETKIPIFGMFITPDSGYGEGAIVILKDSLLSLPQRYVQQIKDMMCDGVIVETVKAHKAAVIITTFESKKFKKTGYDVEFTEL